jgi:hypothetical protein
MPKLAPALKFYVGLVGALLTSIVGSFGPDSPITKVIAIALALVTATGVYLAQNTPEVVSPLDEDLGDPNGDGE